jgi:hypothetical protein
MTRGDDRGGPKVAWLSRRLQIVVGFNEDNLGAGLSLPITMSGVPFPFRSASDSE